MIIVCLKKLLQLFIMHPTMIIIVKELSEVFEKQLTCLGENTEKYITFKIPIEK